MQVLRLDTGVADALESRSPEVLQAACRAAGLTSLRLEALAPLAAGMTIPEEITRKQLG